MDVKHLWAEQGKYHRHQQETSKIADNYSVTHSDPCGGKQPIKYPNKSPTDSAQRYTGIETIFFQTINLSLFFAAPFDVLVNSSNS